MPPHASECRTPGLCWIDRVLFAFESGSFPLLAALGLHRGSTRLWFKRRDASPLPSVGKPKMVGLCGDAADTIEGTKWDYLPSAKMDAPIQYVSYMNIGPVVVRRDVFKRLGGFNTSYSPRGQMGIGFDHELIGRIWREGLEAAVVCPSPATVFRNGCGGKGTAARVEQRKRIQHTNQRLYTAQFMPHALEVETAVAAAQTRLLRDRRRLRMLRHVFPDCVDCEAGAAAAAAVLAAASAAALAGRGPPPMMNAWWVANLSLGFDKEHACPTANITRITFEE